MIPTLAALVRALLTISPGTANLLAYSMLVVVAIFLISGPIIVYIYYRKNKKLKALEPKPSP